MLFRSLNIKNAEGGGTLCVSLSLLTWKSSFTALGILWITVDFIEHIVKYPHHMRPDIPYGLDVALFQLLNMFSSDENRLDGVVNKEGAK